MEYHSIESTPQKLIVVLDDIKEIEFQYQGMKTILHSGEILSLLDFIQYLYCNKGKLEKIFWKEKLNETDL